MTPTCQSGVDLLLDYLEDLLAPDVRATLEQHVLDCARCRAFVDSYRRTPDILRNATAVSLPPGLDRKLRAYLNARKQREKGRFG